VAAKHLGQPIIVENKPGGGGTVGATLILTKPPDGYTIGLTSTNATIIPYYTGMMNFHPVHDYTQIMRTGGFLFGLVVRADSPWKTLQEFLQHSKANPQKVSYGSPGLISTCHLAMEELATLAGEVKWVHMPLKGEAETNGHLLGGHVDASANSGWAPFVDSGKFRPLVVFGAQRSPRFPNVPTLKEAGYNMVWEGVTGFFGPKGMPKPVVNKLHDALRKGMADPAYLNVLKKLQMTDIYLNPEDCEKAIREEAARIEKYLKKLGVSKR
jgi:tripartite-type tricarboxylate transporter receptor subunit TctC